MSRYFESRRRNATWSAARPTFAVQYGQLSDGMSPMTNAVAATNAARLARPPAMMATPTASSRAASATAQAVGADRMTLSISHRYGAS